MAARECPLGCGPLRAGDEEPRDNRFALPHTVRIGWCGTCGLGVTLDPPSPEELGHLYETTYAGPERAAVPRTGRLARVWHRVNGSSTLAERALAGPVLDVGCNTGETLLALRERGLDVVGLEPNPRAASLARAAGLRVIEAPIGEAPLPAGAFGTVLLSHVLEHTPEPHRMLERVRESLRPGGAVLVVVPNAGSVFRSAFGPHWVHWHVPFHLLHFTRKALALLLGQCGFALRRMRTATAGEWLLMSIAARRNAKHGRFDLPHFSGRYGRRLLVAPFGRTADALGAGDAIEAEAVVADPGKQ